MPSTMDVSTLAMGPSSATTADWPQIATSLLVIFLVLNIALVAAAYFIP